MVINLLDVVNSYRAVNPDFAASSLTTDASPVPYIQPSGLYERRCQFDALYVFGDSFSDVGNTLDATQRSLGEGLPPSLPYFQGRFSNGPVWVEYLATLLGLTSKRNTNFAISGATTGSRNTFIPDRLPSLPGLQQQLNSFKALLLAANQLIESRALYIIWAGANDYLSGGSTNPAVPIENLSNAVTSLAGIGAKTILVINLPPLGELPATRKDSQQSAFLNALTQAHNSALTTRLQLLSLALGPRANIILFDVHSLFDRVLTEPTKFGFTNATDSNLEHLAKFQGYTDQFFFWDGIHPTTAAHMLLAKSALAALGSKVTRFTDYATVKMSVTSKQPAQNSSFFF